MELSIVSENSDAESIATNDESLDREESPCEEDQAYPQSTHKTHPVFLFNDIGFLTFTAAGRPCLDDNIKDTLVKIGADAFRNEDVTLPKTKSGTKCIARGMTKSWFEKSLPNGQQVPRTWLLYSPHKEAAYVSVAYCSQTVPQMSDQHSSHQKGFQSGKNLRKLNIMKKTCIIGSLLLNGKRWRGFSSCKEG
jgi:hypothetical protein